MEAVELGLQSRIRICFGAAWAPREAAVLTMEFERGSRLEVGLDSVEEGCVAATWDLVGMSKGIPVCDMVTWFLDFEF